MKISHSCRTLSNWKLIEESEKSLHLLGGTEEGHETLQSKH
jgi:hypothetical protein